MLGVEYKVRAYIYHNMRYSILITLSLGLPCTIYAMPHFHIHVPQLSYMDGKARGLSITGVLSSALLMFCFTLPLPDGATNLPDRNTHFATL